MVPVGRYRHRPWRLSFWRTIGLLFVPSSTNPKSAFTLTDWEYEPITPTGPAKHYPYTGGSMLRLSLHRYENRSHLKHSLKADKSGRRTRRLLVIASAKDMLEPTSWVRCIVVNSYTLQLEEGDPHAVVIRTADPLSVEGPTVDRCQQKEVPADALWLIVPASNYRAPSKTWRQMPECHNNQTIPTDPITEDSDDTDIREYVKKRKANLRIVRFGMWIYRADLLWVVHNTDSTVQLAGNGICCVVRGLFHCGYCSRCATDCCRYQGMLLALPRRPNKQ